ncbi:hypothetical protein [Nocardia sp. NPDC055049]
MAATPQRIRRDLEGVVYLQHRGKTVMLQAGDRVPTGAQVGDHLIDTGKTEPVQPNGDQGVGDQSDLGTGDQGTGDSGDQGTGSPDTAAVVTAKK